VGTTETGRRWPITRDGLQAPALGCVLAVCTVLTGCSTVINLQTPLEQPRHRSMTSENPLPVVVVRGPQHGEVADAIEDYLRHSPTWKLIEHADATQPYSLEWRVLTETFHSDLSTKRSAVVYFYCWVITAPVGLFYANVIPWHATDFLEIQMTLKGSDGRSIYEHKDTLTTNERDKTLPFTDDLKREMRKRTVANLVTIMMNRMEKVVFATP